MITFLILLISILFKLDWRFYFFQYVLILNFMLKFSEEFVSKFNINFQFINDIETQSKAISIEKRRNIFYLYKEIMKSMTSVEGLSYLRVRLIYNNNVFSFKIQTQSSNSTKNNDVRIMLLDSIQHKVQNIKATYSEKLISVNEKEIWVHIKL